MRVLLLLLFITGQCNLIAQVTPKPVPDRPPSQAEMLEDSINQGCMHRNKYSVQQRRAFWPFNKAKKILIVSYAAFDDSVGAFEGKDRRAEIIKKGTPCYNRFFEVTTLSSPQIDSLTDIFYNVGYKGPIFIGEEPECFNPRNAVIFLSASGRALASIEICFECAKYAASSRSVSIGEICREKYDLLRQYFISLGITKGTLSKDGN